MGRRRQSTEAPFCGAVVPGWRFRGTKPLLGPLGSFLEVSAAAGRSDRRASLSGRASRSLPGRRARAAAVRSGRTSPRTQLPEALEARAPRRRLRCQVSEGRLPPRPAPGRLLSGSGCALPGRAPRSAAQTSEEPSPSLGYLSAPAASRRPGPHCTHCALSGGLLGEGCCGLGTSAGRGGVCRERAGAGRPSRPRRRRRRHLGRDTPGRWVWARPRRRGAASAVLPRALFLPKAAGVRWGPAREQCPGLAGAGASQPCELLGCGVGAGPGRGGPCCPGRKPCPRWSRVRRK